MQAIAGLLTLKQLGFQSIFRGRLGNVLLLSESCDIVKARTKVWDLIMPPDGNTIMHRNKCGSKCISLTKNIVFFLELVLNVNRANHRFHAK